MSVLPIRTFPDPVLRTPAAAVGTGRRDLHRLVQDMFETMDDVGGVGLAAPQVGVGLRVFTFDVEGRRGHVVDPVLHTEGELVTEPGEGCLSVPGLHYRPERHARATVTGVDVDGAPVEYRGEGLTARCFQHEVDHLEGLLYIDRLTGEDRRDSRRRLRDAGYGRVAGTTQADRARTVSSSFGVLR
ncbi:peptide deformylase [Citricoccus sp. SGAir0253]|uniref:peptide deformylase n=1 Tax=Citricoccus sp. SGAir0253 TaxID=2567881 RepID=UPI0010CD4AAC|nr:peptide deformylase [Citricoccus sp. SGAir0253]QCU78164.1 peptide deformylase [Citricoccus sp. SGAir0253]